MPRRIYIQIHGTTGIAIVGASVIKPIASAMHSDLFVSDTVSKLIPLDKAPTAAKNFSALYEDIDEKDRFYFNWSGNLGLSVWDTEADFLSKEILKMVGDEEAEVIILGHSHGGNIARIVAENLQDKKNIKFRMITVATPLCLSPPVLMPQNVETWQHFYHKEDRNAYIGSWLMQGICSRTPVKRRIEDVLAVQGDKMPPGARWQSHEVALSIKDPHNDSMRGLAAEFICKTVKPLLSSKEKSPLEDSKKRPASRRRGF